MALIIKNRRINSSRHRRSYAFAAWLAVFLFAGVTGSSPAQLSKLASHPPPQTAPAGPVDPLGRQTPRSTVVGFLKYLALHDYVTAARYMQQPPGKDLNVPKLIQQIQTFHPRYQGDVSLLSDDPNGTVDPVLPLGQMSAGTLQAGDRSIDVVLVRVNDPTWGKIWLVSQKTVAALPVFAAELKNESPTGVNRIRLAILRGPQLLNLSSGQWLGWLISIPVSWLLAWLLAFLLSVPARTWRAVRKLSFHTIWETPLGLPLRCMIAILLHTFFIYLLQPPILYRFYYYRFLAALFVGCLAWFASRITDQGFDSALNRVRTQNRGGESILILMRRLNRVLIAIIALVVALATLGLNITTALAGLGIGGLAIALAAQKTLENLLGGITLLMDKAVQVGDFCKIGDRVGTVEDIGLRSLKIRTLDQNMLVVPNGLLAQMQFENMKNRPKLLIQQSFSLRIETEVEQLRFVLDRIKSMLDQHPMIEAGNSRIRLVGFAGAAFQLELFAYGTTSDWTQLTAIRQDVLLKIVDIVEASGTGFAAQTQLTYLSRDTGIDKEKANDAVRHVADLRASGSFRFPGES